MSEPSLPAMLADENLKPKADHPCSHLESGGGRKMSVMQLLTANYFMVAGGPFGLEDVVHGAGYLGAVLILLLTPLVWSLPTALMVAELSAAIPEDGGYYAWVKRAMGRFWGFQEAWLSLASVGPTATATLTGNGLLTGFLVAMWNCMGWDNASTVAGEVERPQRTYPLAMLGAVALLAVTYVLPVLAVSRVGIAPSDWSTGSWADIARMLGGQWLAVAVVVAGMVSAFGMLNALILSYTRIPVALAEDGFLPKVFTRRIA
ncbi:MAG: APC family permease, partial [Verrucomicrobia bacterium]|nr:APC family permease [Verrucomicrobiota bacterium]